MDINEYCEHLRAGGKRVITGSEQTLWVNPRPLVMQRRPYFALHVPSRQELETVFNNSYSALLSFTLSSSDLPRLVYPTSVPGPIWEVPSYLYICCDPEYSLEKLGQSARSHIRRSLNKLSLRFVDQAELLELGMEAYCDTRTRFGVSQGTREAFKATFCPAQPFRRYLGAFKNERLAAFLVITEVDDWASIGPNYSVNELLSLRPNNGLLYFALRHYLVDKKCRSVDHGLTNVPFTAKVETLHRFKVKMGFEAHPVHRGFVMNPRLRFLVSEVMWRIAHGLQRLPVRKGLLDQMELALRLALRARRSGVASAERAIGTHVGS